MFPSKVLWCDLLTSNLPEAQAFYNETFGWTAQPLAAKVRTDDYHLLYANNQAAAGMFQMAKPLHTHDVPAGWLTYVSVENLHEATTKAVQLGGSCELSPGAFSETGNFSVIRDPAGGRLALYQGPAFTGRDPQGQHGRMVWNELHVTNLAAIQPFYTELFDWVIQPELGSKLRFSIKSQIGEGIASLLLAEADTQKYTAKTTDPKNRSSSEWINYFSVKNLETALQSLLAHGGKHFVAAAEKPAGLAFVSDNQGAKFCMIKM